MNKYNLSIRICLLLLLWTTAIVATHAARPLKAERDTVVTPVDAFVKEVHNHFASITERDIGRLAMEVYFKGNTETTHSGRATRFIPALLPYEPSARPIVFEALCRINYQTPSLLRISPQIMRSSGRRGQKYLKEIYPLLVAVLNVERSRDDRKYIVPFSADGITHYRYEKVDTLSIGGSTFYRIHFEPRKGDHHNLITGETTIDAENYNITTLTCSGLLDFAKFRIDMDLRPHENLSIPSWAHVEIEYQYGKSRGINRYDCTYALDTVCLHDIASEKNQPLDLTPYYKEDPLMTYDWDSIRSIPLTPEEERQLSRPSINTARRRKSLYQTVPERLVSGSNVNAFGTDLKISGPLDPASFGYDKFNGISFSEKLRWSHLYRNGQSVLLRPVIGYNFGIQEIRYQLSGEWIYYPEKRCGLRLSTRNRNSGFSSKFVNAVNNALDSLGNGGADFTDLGLNYHHHYETNLEQSYELRNGLMLYGGLNYHYRTPVKRGERAMSKEQLDALVKDRYIDFNPYLRIEWTPRQYYHFEGRQKLYVASFYPKFAFEYSVSIPNSLGSTSQYNRLELDIAQAIRVGRNRKLSYHLGTGCFFRQHGEYFVNYRYFSRSQRPDSWSDHIGGTFNLLDDYWYASSPAYLQGHIMYETPFMLLNQVKQLSKYVIRERIYLSQLIAKDKKHYTEIGYGMGNNYFNVGAFCGFAGLKYMDFGFKATIEIDQHW